MTDDPLDDSGEGQRSGKFGPLLPPEDRIWRHPSEVSGGAHQAAARPRGVALGHPLGAAAFSAVGGALAVGALWLAMGSGGGRLITEKVSLAPVHTVSPQVVEADEWGAVVTATARGGTVSVRSRSMDEPVAGAVAYRDDGYLLTSARAIEGLDSLLVIDADGVAHDARLVGTDGHTDVSVLHVEKATEVAVVAEGSPDLGDKMAIVDPGGAAVESTVTDPASHTPTTDGDIVLGIVRLDIALGDVPPGSPVVDDTGAVVGITTATDPAAMATFVPIDIARQVAGELIDDGVASHSWLGVTARDVATSEVDAGVPAGALVTSLTSNGPAATGGVMSGDVIVQVGAKPTDSVSAMVAALRYHEPGDEVTFVAERDGETISLSILLGALDDTAG